jgi:hypothetical protein
MKPPNALRVENTYHWPADGESRPWTEFWVTTFTTPVGMARGASILYTESGGGAGKWKHLPMEKSCVLGEQDVWHVNLGLFPAGTRIHYAVEVISPSGESLWDNCHGKDHHAFIGNASDLAAH